jgi:hypothetical protein
MHTLANTLSVFRKYAFHPIKELTLCEMLDDPIVQDVMRSDGIARADVLAACKLLDCNKIRMAA